MRNLLLLIGVGIVATIFFRMKNERNEIEDKDKDAEKDTKD